MKIYVGHPGSIDYRERLYPAIKEMDRSSDHEFVLPHEDSEEPFDSREFLKKECDLMLAEVSESSTGLSIELGWAEILDVPVLCFYRENSEISSSIQVITDEVMEYSDKEDLVEKIEGKLESRW